jgi:uncharacterized membrane protein
MSTLSKVALQRPTFDKLNVEVPRIYASWILGVSLLTSVWTWAAFARNREYSFQLQIAVPLAALGIMALYLGIVSRALRLHSSYDFVTRSRVLAFAVCGFLLLVVFFPEYFMGGLPSLPKSSVLLGLSFLLSISYVAIASRNSTCPINARPSVITPIIVLVTACVVYFILISLLTLTKLRAFGYVGQDIAYFTQCLYTTLHGHLLYSNMYHDLLYGRPVTSDFAGHNQAILFLFLPFYAVHKSASTLLIVRNLCIAFCAVPVYLISRRTLPPWQSVAASAAFLLVPAVLYQNIYDFAPLSVAALPLLFAFYYFAEQSFTPFIVAVLFTQIVREDLVFAVFGLGLLALWQHRSLRWVAFPCGLAIGWAVLSWKVVFPYFLGGTTSAVASCFAYLGNSPSQMLHGIVSHPAVVLSRENLIYAKQLVDSLGGFLFLFNPAWLMSVPYGLINLLGQGGGCNTAMIYRHYSMIPATVLFASMLFGLEKLPRVVRLFCERNELSRFAIVLFVLAASVSSLIFVTGTPQIEEFRAKSWGAEARNVAAMLPADASVSVPRYMLPFVANRGGLYQSLRLLEYHNPDSQYIVFDKDWTRMAASSQWKANYYKLWHLVEASPDYSVVYDSFNYLIYKRCNGCPSNLQQIELGQQMHE